MSNQYPGYVLEIERTFDASAEEVFDAWTSEEVMRRWFHADPAWETPTAEVDLRVGGRLRLVMRDPNAGEDYGATGEYTESWSSQFQADDQPRHLQRGARGLPPGGLGYLLRQPGPSAGALRERHLQPGVLTPGCHIPDFYLGTILKLEP